MSRFIKILINNEFKTNVIGIGITWESWGTITVPAGSFGISFMKAVESPCKVGMQSMKSTELTCTTDPEPGT